MVLGCVVAVLVVVFGSAALLDRRARRWGSRTRSSAEIWQDIRDVERNARAAEQLQGNPLDRDWGRSDRDRGFGQPDTD